VTVFRFVEREKARHPVATMCRLLGVSASGYWAWRRRGPSARALADAALAARIRRAHAASRGTYGAPRVHAELRAAGVRCARKRISRLMRQDGLVGVHRRRFVRTTARDRRVAPAPDLVERDFRRDAPDRLWVADLTYLPTGCGFLYLAALVDAWSRLVVGWAMAGHLRAELVTAALDMALARRQPRGGLVHHSDHGIQYASLASGGACVRRASRPPWDRAATPTTTPWRRASSPASSASSSIAAAGGRPRRPGSPSSTTSRSSTTASAVTRRSATSPRPSSKGGTVPRRRELTHRPRKRDNSSAGSSVSLGW
jgi:putative transposase